MSVLMSIKISHQMTIPPVATTLKNLNIKQCGGSTLECYIMWIKRVGILEVEMKVEETSGGENIRRSFRVVCKKLFQSPLLQKFVR